MDIRIVFCREYLFMFWGGEVMEKPFLSNSLLRQHFYLITHFKNIGNSKICSWKWERNTALTLSGCCSEVDSAYQVIMHHHTLLYLCIVQKGYGKSHFSTNKVAFMQVGHAIYVWAPKCLSSEDSFLNRILVTFNTGSIWACSKKYSISKQKH